jgi:hypothetical protein
MKYTIFSVLNALLVAVCFPLFPFGFRGFLEEFNSLYFSYVQLVYTKVD